MKELLAWGLEGARRQTLRLAEGIAPERTCFQSESGEHHPLWTVGHLVLADSYLLALLGATTFRR